MKVFEDLENWKYVNEIGLVNKRFFEPESKYFIFVKNKYIVARIVRLKIVGNELILEVVLYQTKGN